MGRNQNVLDSFATRITASLLRLSLMRLSSIGSHRVTECGGTRLINNLKRCALTNGCLWEFARLRGRRQSFFFLPGINQASMCFDNEVWTNREKEVYDNEANEGIYPRGCQFVRNDDGRSTRSGKHIGQIRTPDDGRRICREHPRRKRSLPLR